MKDKYYHRGMRRKLVAQLRQKGIKNEHVLEAIGRVPRHFFLDNAFEELAYEDQALPIGEEQTISQPYTVAFQTELLDVQKGHRVLEIGTGSGYQASILAALGAEVYSIERQENLYWRTKELFRKMQVNNVRLYLGDGYEGLPKYAPFDKIIVTAGAITVPETLQEQLLIGGTMVVPVGRPTQQMYRVVRITETEFYSQVYGEFRFVPFEKGVKKRK
ncbi:MAG: protein-L-isoaspartate(D-aspartate) O-methyltransferase [Bacteroidota bacterium]